MNSPLGVFFFIFTPFSVRVLFVLRCIVYFAIFFFFNICLLPFIHNTALLKLYDDMHTHNIPYFDSQQPPHSDCFRWATWIYKAHNIIITTIRFWYCYRRNYFRFLFETVTKGILYSVPLQFSTLPWKRKTLK